MTVTSLERRASLRLGVAGGGECRGGKTEGRVGASSLSTSSSSSSSACLRP